MKFAITVQVLAVLMFGGFGAWLLLQPEQLETLVGLAADSPAAKTELRTFYGGLELGLAAMFLWGAIARDLTGPFCLALGLTSTGLAAGRVYGLAVDGSASTQMYAFLATELLFAGLGFAGYVSARRAKRIAAGV